MLPTKVCELHGPCTVDDENRRALAQRKEFTFDLVLFVHSVVCVHQTGERDGIVSEVSSCFLRRISHDGNNLSTCVKELLVLGRQLTEVSSTERSHEAPQKDQHHT